MLKYRKTLIILGIIIVVIFIHERNQYQKMYQIGKDLVQVDSISDFSSNKNYPVENTENIGENLYKILRSIDDKSPDNFSYKIKIGDDYGYRTFKGRFFNDAHYSLLIFNHQNQKSLSVRLRYDWYNRYFKILGYSGRL